MNAEFNWWLLIVGLVVGAGLVWFVLMDARRREVDIDEQERPREALWLSRMLADEGHDVSPEAADRLLSLHRSYLEAPPPDETAVSEPDIPPLPASASGLAPAKTSGPTPVTGAASERAEDDRIRLERGARDIGQ